MAIIPTRTTILVQVIPKGAPADRLPWADGRLPGLWRLLRSGALTGQRVRHWCVLLQYPNAFPVNLTALLTFRSQTTDSSHPHYRRFSASFKAAQTLHSMSSIVAEIVSSDIRPLSAGNSLETLAT